VSDTYAPDDHDDEEPSPRDLRHKLAEQTREANELRARLEATERDAAFAKALGPAADDPRVKDYFVPGYKGELDAERIRQAALDAGFLNPDTPPPPAPAAEPPPSRIAAASSGAGTPPPADLYDAIRAANSEAEVMAILESPEGAAAGLRTTRQNQ